MKIYFVDSFTSERFKGNPAAVCICEALPDEATMQNIAAEIGFSETAFVCKLETDVFSICFFTPKKEIPLCGHATLAAAKILFEINGISQLSFTNIEHVELKIQMVDRGIKMAFPVYETSPITVPEKMLAALGIRGMINAVYSEKNKIILLEIEDSVWLQRLRPDFGLLVDSYDGINGVLVTARSRDENYDFQYRYFWPWAGTNEDPVTGGVQTFLTKYWASRLNKTQFRAFQCSERTGSMFTELVGDKVYIVGEAIVTLEGTFKLS